MFRLLLPILFFLALPAAAQPRDATADAERYERCLDQAKQRPEAAWESALAWRDAGGGHPAEHCVAVALIGLRQPAEAAMRLERLAVEMKRAPTELRAEVLGQAGQAWMLFGDPTRAQATLTQALTLLPDDPDLLTDRAEATASSGRYEEAVADLDRVLAKDPKRVDALIYRASARRALDRLEPALADIQEALKLVPNSTDALLERGNLRRLKGDAAGARQDWVRVSLLAPGTPADAAAKANLEKLDVRLEPAPAPAKRR
jgi:tetratricopeptide (TPR) repeat protein